MVLHTPSYYNYSFLDIIQKSCNIFCFNCRKFLLEEFPVDHKNHEAFNQKLSFLVDCVF